MRNRPFMYFAVLAMGCFVTATLGFDVLARVFVAHEGIGRAVSDHLRFAVMQPLGTALLLAPWLALGGIAGWIAAWKGFDRGLGVFLLGMLLLGFTYFNGFFGAQDAGKAGRWTAATLSVGLLPFISLPLLLICLVFGCLVRSKRAGKSAEQT